jgi:diguanylate cyclase (GGDEF)-like protein
VVCDGADGFGDVDRRLQEGRYDVLVVDGDHPGDAAMNLLRRLRRARWPGTILYTGQLVGDARLHELTRELGVRAVFLEPLVLAEVEIRLARVVPGARPGGVDPEDAVPAGWNGALRDARKAYGKRLPVWVRELLHQATEARRTRAPEAMQSTATLARRIAGDAGLHGFGVIAEVTGAVADVLEALASGRRALPTATPWDHVDALLEVLQVALPGADRTIATVSTGQVEVYDTCVLVASSDLDQLHAIATLAERRRIGLLTARDLKEAVRVAGRRRIDAALVAADLPDRGASVLTDWLRRQPGHPDLPVAWLVQRGEGDDATRIASARAAGARFVVELPLDESRLRRALEKLTAQRPRPRPRVLLVDDDPRLFGRLVDLLAPHQVEVVHEPSPRAALDALPSLAPDLVVLDVMLPVISGFDVCRQVRATPSTTSVPVLFLTAQDGSGVRQACFRAGGDACLPADVGDDELVSRVVTLIHRFRAVREVDPTSGALLRRALLDALRAALDSGAELAVGLVDVDGFREVNRIFGYAAGDRVLAEVVDAVQRGLGEDVAVGRWGDDQLAVVLPGESRSSALVRLEHVARRVRALAFDGGAQGRFQVSVQLATAATGRTGRDPELLLQHAEAALAQAKLARA